MKPSVVLALLGLIALATFVRAEAALPRIPCLVRLARRRACLTLEASARASHSARSDANVGCARPGPAALATHSAAAGSTDSTRRRVRRIQSEPTRGARQQALRARAPRTPS